MIDGNEWWEREKAYLKDTRAPDHGDYDVLEAVLPAANKRGMKTICWLEDVFRKDGPNIEKVQEVDLHGRKSTTLYSNNRDYRNFLTGFRRPPRRYLKTAAARFEYSVMNYKERGIDEIAFTGLSSDYVYRETKRAKDGVAGTKTEIWPGIDIDIPTADNQSKSTPHGTKNAVLAAFRAQAQGVILSRKYSEMKLANLSGAGAAIRELGLA